MNYSLPYNNVYGSTPYLGNGYYPTNQVVPNNGYYQPNQIQQYNQYQQQQTQTPMLSGKYVDSIDVVKVSEVPMGSVGLFVKADMTEMYVKSWNPDGTTKISTYKPVVESSRSEETISTNDIMNHLNLLNEKIDRLTKDLGA